MSKDTSRPSPAHIRRESPTSEKHPMHRGLMLTFTGLALLVVALMIGCLSVPDIIPLPQLQPTATTLSTYTPPVTWPPTWTPTHTPIATHTPTPRPTFISPYATTAPGSWSPSSSGTSPHAGGDLTIDFNLNDVWCTSGSSYAASFTVWARGGDGRYIYYRDIDKIAGPLSGEVNYELQWRECGGAPGTFFVESGDGQRVGKKFWVWPPDCCKPTPTATP
jgi:hypothetical protein